MSRVVLWSWGASVAVPHHGDICHCLPSQRVSQGVFDTPSDAKVSFFENLVKKFDSSSSSQKKIFGFLYLSLKLSLTLLHKGKMLWCSYFRSLIKSAIFSRCRNFIKKMNFVSTPCKIIIPLGNSVGDHIRVIEICLGG